MIAVSDTGRGIPPEALPRIFERFHQVDGSSTRRVGGMGLGLTIVKSILDTHKAPVEVESEVGKGTTFRFRLPLAPEVPSLEEKEIGRPPAPASLLKKKVIEIVDDDKDFRNLVMMYLKAEGLEVLEARNGQEGFYLASTEKPDLILLDIYLPDLDGFDLLSVLKRDPQTKGIPVVILSVVKEPHRGLELGASDFLVKPTGSQEIVSTVRRILLETARKKILIVDDEPDTVEFLSQGLEIEGYQTFKAYEGVVTLKLAAERQPDLILLDLMMPGIDGWEVIRELKQKKETQEIPVIIITAKGGREDREKGLQLGAKKYIPKPFEIKELLGEIKEIIKK